MNTDQLIALCAVYNDMLKNNVVPQRDKAMIYKRLVELTQRVHPIGGIKDDDNTKTTY